MKQLFFTLLAIVVPAMLFAQDLTGTWEGKQEVNGKKYDYTLYLSRSDHNGYTGVSYLREKTSLKINLPKIDINNPLNSRMNVKTNASEDKFGVKVTLLGSFTNHVLTFSDLSIIQSQGNTKNVELFTVKLDYSKSKKQEQLVGTDPKFRITFTKKSDDFPDEYAKYRFKEIISVNSIKYANETGLSKIRFNDMGTITFNLTNHSDIDLDKINFNFLIKENDKDLKGAEGKIGIINLPKMQSENGYINMTSGFNLPDDSAHFTLEAMYGDVLLFSKDFAFATEPFYLNAKTAVMPGSKQTLTALQGFYGFNKAKYSAALPNLNQLITSGNKFANMWKGLFQFMGWNNVTINEDLGIQSAKRSYSAIMTAARNGDAEAQYLLSYAIGMGLGGPNVKSASAGLLKKAADAEFGPAMYDYANLLYNMKKYEESLKLLQDCYNDGIQKAAINIGYFNQNGYGTGKDSRKAIEWYQKGEAFGDPEALMQLAKIYSSGEEDMEPDVKKAVGYASKAAALKNTTAINFLARMYLNGRSGLPKNVLKAVALYKEAADLGDHIAMSALAYLYLSGSSGGVVKNEKTAILWAKKSAEAGGADCMALLADLYEKGKIGGKKDVIRTRFWANQAYLNGYGEKDNTADNARTNDFGNMFSNIDLRDKYSYWRDTDTGLIYESNDGPDLLGGIAGGIWAAMEKRRSEQQTVINGLELMYESAGRKVYGGTLTSKINTEITLTKGQAIKIKAYGNVSLGMWAGSASPDGVAGFQSYSIDPAIPHGAILAKVGNRWTYIGSEKNYKAAADGRLQVAINDVDYTNNKGYFDFVITLE